MDRLGFLAGAARHGGRLAAAEAAFPAAPRPWLDLSTGINPSPWRGRRAAADLRRLPDPVELARLEAVAAEAFGAAPDRIAATPGTEVALRLLPRLLGARRVDIASPTYGGHEDAARATGAEVRRIARRDLNRSDADLTVVVNPNNPDGAITPPAALLDAARAGPWLIVDEAFAETAPEVSAAAATLDRLIVLRSFGKFYGLPGLRLGFVVAAPAMLAKVRDALGDWPVSADAIAIGCAAYADDAWREGASARLARDARRLDDLLAASGFTVLGGTSLFRLAAAPDAQARFLDLCALGVLARPFADEPTWLRFGLPAPRDWPRLAAALGEAAR